MPNAQRWPNRARAAAEDASAYMMMASELAQRLDAEAAQYDATLLRIHEALDNQDWRMVRHLIANQRSTAANVRSVALSIRGASDNARAVLTGALRGEYNA